MSLRPFLDYAAWEGEMEKSMWPLELRVRLQEDWDIRFLPALPSNYIIGWCTFRARGETCVECLHQHMEFGTDPKLFTAAWTFYVAMRLQGRVVFAHGKL